MNQSHRMPFSAMSDHASGHELRSARLNLAVAVAHGEPIKSWAEANNTSLHTAHRWASQPEFKRAVSGIRRRCADLAAGRLAGYANKAAQVMTNLAVNANSESVKLAAFRAIFSDMMAVSEFADLEDRMTEIEEQLRERTGNGIKRVKARLARSGPVVDRSPWDWYAESCSCGLPPGECRAHPRAPADPAAARGRLAGLGVRRRPRGRQDAGRGLLDSAPGRRRHHEARLPDRPDRRRYPRRDGRGPVGPDRRRARHGAGLGSNRRNAASNGPTAPARSA